MDKNKNEVVYISGRRPLPRTTITVYKPPLKVMQNVVLLAPCGIYQNQIIKAGNSMYREIYVLAIPSGPKAGIEN